MESLKQQQVTEVNERSGTSVMNMDAENVSTSKENSSELIQVIEINDCPLTIVVKDEKIMIALGYNVLKTGFESIKEAKDYIRKKPWDLLLTAAAVFTNELNKIEK